jgi:hypothetical protein
MENVDVFLTGMIPVTIRFSVLSHEQSSQISPNRKEIGGAPRTVRTIGNEEAILDAFEEGTESISEVAQE